MDIRARALKLWENGEFLRAQLEGRELFPWGIPVPPLKADELLKGFSDVRDWIARLDSGSKESLGHGYVVEKKPIHHRKLGTQSVPRRIRIDTPQDFLSLMGKQRDFNRFEKRVPRILDQLPSLRDFLVQRPSLVLQYEDDWDRLSAVCGYFLGHPKPGLYLRQLDIPGVDTKFIESHLGFLSELLETVLPESSKAPGVRGSAHHGFERRFGLLYEPPTVRFRLLDPTLSIMGLTDLSVPLAEFQNLKIPVRRVFIVENKMNGLCFPNVEGAMVVFGMGYGVGALAGVDWLRELELYYWGDVDTHGFAILERVRSSFPHVRSFLMDQATLMTFRDLCVQEEPTQRFTKDLPHLTTEEAALYEGLRGEKWGARLRLEQERVAYGYVRQKLDAMLRKRIGV